MKIIKLGFCTAILALGGCAQAEIETLQETEAPAAVAASPVACQMAEYRQLDFWVGDWALSWDNGDGTMGAGTNIISREGHGDCVIYYRKI